MRCGYLRVLSSEGSLATEVAVIRLLVALIYLAVGIVVANDHNYLAHLNDTSQIISAVLAVVLWPVVLLGADLHIGGVPKVKIKR